MKVGTKISAFICFLRKLFVILQQDMLDRIYNILTSFLGESKQGYFDSSVYQYQFNCPECTEENGGVPDNKYNLEINLALGKVHCWKCEFKGNISILVKRWGGKLLLEEYYKAVKELKESKYLDINLFNDDGTSNGYVNDYLQLPSTFTKIDLKSCRNKKLVAYLNKRKIDQSLIDYYNIGYTTWDEEKPSMRSRIIIPSYDSAGELNYWVGRDFLPPKKMEEITVTDDGSGNTTTKIATPNFTRMKYMNCKVDKKNIILHEDKIQWDATIYLCEGALDCIYYPNSIALMGKALSKEYEIYQKLYEKANGNIVICLDADTDINETKRIYNLLNRGRLRGKIRYIRMEKYKDFGEVYEAEGKKGMIGLMKTAKSFNEIELLI